MVGGHLGSAPVPGLDAYSARLRRLHETTPVGDLPASDVPRRLISASWRRSLAAGVDPDAAGAPAALAREELRDARSAHPLAALLPLITGTLLETAAEIGCVLLVTDAQGRVLWRDGDHRTMTRADAVGLADGFHWSEETVGTNGIGTALAVHRPVHVRAAEHLLRVLHSWSCASAPVVDPDGGALLGCVDVSGVADGLHPAAVALVEATARLAESRLALRMHEDDERFRARHESLLRALRGEPGALVTGTGRVLGPERARQWGERIDLPASGDEVTLADGRTGVLEPLDGGFLLRVPGRRRTPLLTLSFLGAEHPSARIDGVRVPLSLRHAEILALLVLNPKGLTADRLSFQLYGDEGNPVTIRAEIHRLRTQLGPVVAAKPYRLKCPVEADFVAVKHLLVAEDAAPVARAYTGPLLPRSESPAVRAEREELEGQVRARILRRGGPEDLWAYAGTEHGRNDVHVLQRLAAALLPDDPRAVTARIRLAALGRA
ncbi:GAF domain-containing protein [Planomonospora corallina]|uniref:GAF domain-containing protein n=1 Tax=Planomonospora corallina TaxID=1806052 RepID=A0ABV8HYV5_9ACTN